MFRLKNKSYIALYVHIIKTITHITAYHTKPRLQSLLQVAKFAAVRGCADVHPQYRGVCHH